MTNETTPGMSGQSPPPVIRWFKVYTGVMTGIYALCIVAGPLVMFAATKVHADERVVLMIQGAILMIVGLLFGIAFALPFFLPRKPWVWIYNLVLICIGMTSCCILPATVPLIIFWIKPDVKLWFNRT